MTLKRTFTYTVRVPQAATTWHRENSTFQTDSYGMARRVAMNFARSKVSGGVAVVINNNTGATVFTHKRQPDDWYKPVA